MAIIQEVSYMLVLSGPKSSLDPLRKAKKKLTGTSSAVQTVVFAPEGLVPEPRDFARPLAVCVLIAIGLAFHAGVDVDKTEDFLVGLVVTDAKTIGEDAAFVYVLEKRVMWVSRRLR